MNFIKILLFPVSIIYGLITFVRNKLFDFKILPSKSFEIPVITVGNITVGGTGKTPHIEYLAKLISKSYDTAILSRGYGRTTKGYILADKSATASTIGDESKQYVNKFDTVTVAVCENRVKGIKSILKDRPNTQVVLLDDAFQHRYVKPTCSILIKEHDSLNEINFMLPTGTNREYESGMKRANIIIISKCPPVFSGIQKRNALELFDLEPHQTAYFTYVKYGQPIALNKNLLPLDFSKENKFRINKTAVIVTGIANPKPLISYFEDLNLKTHHINFEDHHKFSVSDLLYIQKIFDSIVGEKFIITTEKDATRLQDGKNLEITKQLPIYYVPIEVEFHGNEKQQFNSQILDVCQN